MRVTPMPSGTPMSFGHDAELLSVFLSWYDEPNTNHGVALVAEQLDPADPDIMPSIDQHIHLIRTGAVLRITLDRR